MTINIVLVTSEAIVFGCDSTSTASRQMVDRGKFQSSTAQGNDVTAKFSRSDFQSVVVRTVSGVRKMFPVGTPRVPMMAVTSGVAKLKKRTIASLALEFHRSALHGDTVAATVENFRAFMRTYYEGHYQQLAVPNRFRDALTFLVGGYGKDAKFPALHRVDVKEDTTERLHWRGSNGIAWAGKADAVSRIVLGFDHHLRQAIYDIDKNFPFDQFRAGFEYADLPLQEAINMVAYLVLVQSAKERFVPDIPVVGGRTHIGVITKERGIQLINEPELTHEHIGFFDDQ